jgi:hypothetical protein
MNLARVLVVSVCVSIVLGFLAPTHVQATSLNVGFFFVTNIQVGVDAFAVDNVTGSSFDPFDGFPVATSLAFDDPVFTLFFSSGPTQTTSPDIPYTEGLFTSAFEFSDSLQLTQVLFSASIPAGTLIVLDDGSKWIADSSVTGTLLPAGTFIDQNDFGLITINANPVVAAPEPNTLIILMSGFLLIALVIPGFKK